MAVNRTVCSREGICTPFKGATLISKFLCIRRQPSSLSSPVEHALPCSVTETDLHLAHPDITCLTLSSLLIGCVFSCRVRALRDDPLMYSPPALTNEGPEVRRPATHVKWCTTPTSPSSARRTFDRLLSTPATSLHPAKMACVQSIATGRSDVWSTVGVAQYVGLPTPR